jgi:CRISPR/Cas system-associated exonuclease Cas4 (RecB family)
MIYSYSSYSCYETCPRQFYYRYVARCLPFVETEQMKWGNRVHKALALRLKVKEPLPDALAQFEPLCASLEAAAGPILIEQTLVMDREGRPVQKPRGFVSSRPDFVTFDEGYSHAFIIDWKTGKPREDDTELCFQFITLQVHYPTLQTADAAYYWTKERRMGPVYDVVSQAPDVWSRLCEVVDLIALQTQDGEKAFPAKPGKHFPCPYCAATFCPAREDA